MTTVALTGTGIGDKASQDVSLCTMSTWALRFDVKTPTTFEILVSFILPPSGETPGDCDSTSRGYDSEYARFDHSGARQDDTPVSNNAHNLATGRDGRIYRFNYLLRTIDQLANDGVTWTRLAGLFTGPACVDGSVAKACALAPEDLHIRQGGQLYYAQSGTFVALLQDGTVQTVAGQPFSAGDGGDPLAARFASLSSVDFYYQGADLRLQLLDARARRIREVRGTTVVALAGNGFEGAVVNGVDATSSPLNVSKSFSVASVLVTNGANGDVIYRDSLAIERYSRATGTWFNLGGSTGPTSYKSADGLTLDKILLSAPDGAVQPIGASGDDFLVMGLADRPDAYTSINPQIKQYGFVSLTQTPVSTFIGPVADDWCLPGTPLGNCALPDMPLNSQQRASFDATLGWIIADQDGLNLYSLRAQSGAVLAKTLTLQQSSRAFAYIGGAGARVYSCDTTGALHRVKISSQADQTVAIAPGLTCVGRAMVYDSVSSRLFFIVANGEGLTALARYTAP